MHRLFTFAAALAALFIASPALANSPNIVAHLAVAPVASTGPCPAVFTFKGTIATSNWSPTALRRVQYKFIRSDGANGPIQTLSFPTVAGGVRAVSTTWTLGATYGGWEAIQILYPQNVQSNKAAFRLACRKK